VKITVCSCCGHPTLDAGARGALTPMQKRFFDIVLRAGTAGITGPEIMNLLYEDDPEGGAECRNVVPVTAQNIRKRIEPFGITLVGTRGIGSAYYVVPMYRKAEFVRGTSATTRWRKSGNRKREPRGCIK
jgi:hypothetical protein